VQYVCKCVTLDGVVVVVGSVVLHVPVALVVTNSLIGMSITN